MEGGSPSRRASGRNAISTTFAITIIALLLIAIISVPLIFLNYRDVRIQESKEVPYISGISNATIRVAANRGNLNVTYENLSGPLVVLQATVLGKAGFFGNTYPLNLTLNYSVDNGTLAVNGTIDTYGPWPFYTLSRINYDLRIDTSLRSAINVTMVTGGIVLNATSGAVLEGIHLEATSSGVKMNLDGASLAGDVFVKTATGGTEMIWRNVTVARDIGMEFRESSGKISADILQSNALLGNVTIKAVTTAGPVNLILFIDNTTGGIIKSKSSVGGIEVLESTGFNENNTVLQSVNYPADHNFDATLNTTVGGISITARYL